MFWDKKRSMLEKRLKKYPPICPKCKNNMDFGYLCGNYTRWRESREKRSIYKWLASIPDAIPSYLCKDCNLVIGQYKLKPKNRKYNNPSNKIFDYCPNCNYKLKLGFTFSHRRTSWSKNKHIAIGKILAWTTTWPHKKLPTKKCTNCGLFYLRYKTKR